MGQITTEEKTCILAKEESTLLVERTRVVKKQLTITDTKDFDGDWRIVRSLSLLRDLKSEGSGKMREEGKIELQLRVMNDMVTSGPVKFSMQVAEKKVGE